MQGRLTPWLPATNVAGFLERGTTYFAQRCATATGCEQTVVSLSYAQSWTYLSVFGLVLATLALLVFRRRDVV
jgi:hypothetical protein